MLAKMGKYVTSFDGTKIYYEYNKGNNPFTLVFLHGVGANLTVWGKEISHFGKKGFSTIALDLRGHGQSDAPLRPSKYRPPYITRDIYEVLKKEKVADFSLVGHSLGGAVAINYCMLHKKRLPISLILIESTAVYPFEHDHLFNMSPYVTHLLRFIAQHKLTKRQHLFHFNDVDLSEKGIEGDLNMVLHLLHLTPLRSIVKTLDCMEWYGFKNRRKIDSAIKHLEIPTLLIAGEFDRMVPTKYSEMIRELDKKAELKIIKAGHRVIINHPRMVSKMIDCFLREKCDIIKRNL